MRCNLAGGMGTGGAFASHGFLCSGHGATAARLTPDQKVGSSNLSGLICSPCALSICPHLHTELFWAKAPPAYVLVCFLETGMPVFLPLKRQVEDD